MAIFVIFKFAAAAILVFEKFEILTVCLLYGANLLHCAKFHEDRSIRCFDIAIFCDFSRWRPPPSWIFENSKFKISTVCPL